MSQGAVPDNISRCMRVCVCVCVCVCACVGLRVQLIEMKEMFETSVALEQSVARSLAPHRTDGVGKQ